MLQKCSTWKVAQVFFNEPTKEHYLMEISRKSNLSHTSVKKHLKTLKDKEIITEEERERGKRTYKLYKSNTDNLKYKNTKKIDLINRLSNNRLIKHLEDLYQPDCIVLFGSAARGEDTEESDIDLFLQAKGKKKSLRDFEEKLNREIQLHLSPKPKNYPKELKNNIANGTVLHGYLDIF